MANSSIITSLITLINRGAAAHLPVKTRDVVSVGLVIDQSHVVWGDVVPVLRSTHSAELFSISRAGSVIDNTIQPVLVGQPLTSLRDLCHKIDSALGHTQDPLMASIACGVSQAVLSALAWVDGVSPAEVIAREYALTLPNRPIPIHAEIDSTHPAATASIIVHNVGSLGYTSPISHPHVVLGSNGQFLQRYIRQLKQQVSDHLARQLFAQVDGGLPAFQINVQGGFGPLYLYDTGRMLGAIVGLESVIKPEQLRIVDPVRMPSQVEQIKTMALLKSFLRIRRMQTEIVAKYSIDTRADVEAFVAGNAAHVLHLNLPSMGNICQTVEAILACREKEVGVIVGSESAETSNTIRIKAHLALATQPLAVEARPQGDMAIAITHNEMMRTLVEWQTSRSTAT